MEEKICIWKETRNNPDWFYVTCIQSKVNIWKLCRKKHITPVQMFLSCPYCNKKVHLQEDNV